MLITIVALVDKLNEILFGLDDEILKVIVFDILNADIEVSISVNNVAIDEYT